MIAAEGITLRRDGRTLVDDLRHAFRAGCASAIIGPNGAGKSTLLSILAGQLAPDAGRVLAGGRDLAAMSRRERAERIAWLPQNEAQDVPFTAGEYVALGGFGRRSVPDGEVERLLASVGLPDFRDRPVERLSGGEFRLAAIARALAQETPAILVDEIDLGLDLANRALQAEALAARARDTGRLLVAVVHDVNVASLHFDEILLLGRGGRLLAAGPPRGVITKRNLDALYMADLFVHEGGSDGTPVVAAAARRRRQAPTGRRVHVVCGGGEGGAALDALSAAGARLSCGVLNVGDSDWKCALELGAEIVAGEPFSPIDEAARRENLERMRAADATLVIGMPVGTGNLANLEDALAIAREFPGRVRLLSPARFSDHAGGRATALFAQLLRHAETVERPETLA